GRLRQGLARTQSAFVGRLDAVLTGRGGIDEEAFEEIEEILYTADLGVATATRLLAELREASERGGGGEALRESLKQSVEAILAADAETTAGSGEEKPRVVLFVGVNGVGKTTTIGKIGAGLVAEGKTVILAAADTFRAAAIEQLEIWGKRIGATVIKQETSSDPSAVVFDAVAAAKSRKADVVLVDTAGRLHTKANLMEELKKMTRILGREIPGAPHEVILVLDATTGQNALTQARQFNEAVGVTGIALTKLDGTARGGIVIAVHEELKLPIRYIGVGERVDDLRPFDAHDFVEALFARD
ncbi:MAG: signal recognition particle-docking protein FtsY, partial [Myxococcota bacterium]